MGGGMEAHKNKFIEEWGAARENLEYNFRWTRRNLVLAGIFGVAVPILVYRGIVKEFFSFSVLLSNFKRNFLSGFSFPLGYWLVFADLIFEMGILLTCVSRVKLQFEWGENRVEGKENAEISLRKLSNLNDVVVSDDKAQI
ncbi:hypothetical protein CK203_031156 [Vitis vinifera]|uniref:Uncharacterized protein n=1 Tax=Vitis vinifera TaxID=29760 RepID=A0A438J0M9_VITVI|nr:hypothetical protein CK203_031156 [Vitis vinifera]